MNYVQVKNGQVVTDPAPLPQSYRFADLSQTGNFDLLDAVNALTTQLDVVNYTISMS